MFKPTIITMVAVLALTFADVASADVFNMGGTRNPGGSWTGLASLETVTVGNPGNEGELSGVGAGGYGQDRICGAVDYSYNIGKYQVTAGQYTEFLNAVASADTYSLYSTMMWSSNYGCGIQRSGSPESYTYCVADDWANRPVNFVSWGDAARFCNWLHNGQPSGPQDLSTTEDGAYDLNGAMSNTELIAVTRKPDWKWAITSEDEWYKAAYHKNDGTTGNYFSLPMSSSAGPGYVTNDTRLSGTSTQFVEGGTDPGNYATFNGDAGTYGIGSPYYRTVVGEWENSDSPYGTFDQAGNVQEWNESVVYEGDYYVYRGFRGAGFSQGFGYLRAASRMGTPPTNEFGNLGFRVSHVPEPSTLCLLPVGILLLRSRRRVAHTNSA